MSKKILFMNSAKLTAISLGVLLAIFCTIGMSFTPADEGDNVGDPNDSTYITGPRRSHWTGTNSCGGTTYNNKKDYGKVIVTVVGGTGGTVSASGANSTSSTANNNSTSVTVTWNCGYSDSDNHSDLTAKHTNKITFTANKTTGYNFDGWYSDAACTQLVKSDLSYSEDFVIGHDSWGTAQNTEYESSGSAQTWNRYAKFVEIEPVDLTFIAPGAGGSYTVTINGSSSTVTSANVVKTGITTEVALVATPASGYVFAGWYQIDGEGNVSDLSASTPYNKTFAKSVSVGARFVSTSTPKFKNITKNAEYYGLRLALSAASANDVIIPVAEETVVDGSDLLPQENGLYVLPSGVKLLIPYNSSNSFQTLPNVLTSAATLSAYKKLILKDGVNIEVNGAICVGGQAMAGSGGNPAGYTTGACGLLDMSAGGHIDIKSGGTLYCWGFVKGQDIDQGNNTTGVGTITANNGAVIWETFSVGDWRGGSATSSIISTRFFPFQSYFMQNIEVPTTFWYGSTEKCYFTLNASGGPYDTKFDVIGSSNCLFKLQNSSSKVRKWYDPTTDLTCFELSGTAILDALKIKITGIPLIGTLDINSEDFDLPITSGMHIILTNCTMTLNKPLTVQPGAVVEIKDDANVTLATNVFLYDKDDWGPWVCGKYFKATSNLTNHKNRGDGTSNANLDDAKFIVDGTFTITSGKLYSTPGGADVMGNGGGSVVFPNSLASASTLTWYKSTTTSGSGETGTVAVNQANLHNEDESYTKAVKSSTFYNVNGRWFVSGKQNINPTTHVYDEFTYIASGAVSGTGGTDISPATKAVYAPDKTGLVAGIKWCNVSQDATCTSIYNATQKLHDTEAANIRYTYQGGTWIQLLKISEGLYNGSNDNLYALESNCTLTSLGSVDGDCLYTLDEGGVDVKKAFVNGSLVALTKNTEDEAWHNTSVADEYYVCFSGCTWHSATKYPEEEKAYIVEGGNYIWYNGDWKLVERQDPYFFDYNEQNVQVFYEYENGTWVLATPRVRVVDAIETRNFYFINEAFTVANGKKNTTITLLKDIPTVTGTLTYSAKNTTCTFDLNGHTVHGACATLLEINASGSTFTITDTSSEKNGRLENVFSQNAVTYGINLTAGTLYVANGYIYDENPMQYSYGTSSVGGTETNKTSVGTRCLYLSAGTTTYIQGGTIHAKSSAAAHGIFELSNKNNNTTLNVSGGTIYAEAARYAYGVRARGKLNITGGLIKSRLNTSLTNGNATYLSKKNDDYTLHRYGYGIYIEPVGDATAANNYAGTLTMSAGRIESYNDNFTSGQNLHTYGINFGATSINVPSGQTAADGTLSQKSSGKGTITGGSIYVENQGLLSYGILHSGNYNSYESKSHVLKISNCSIEVKAYQTAYGIYANASIGTTSSSSTRNLAAMYFGDVELTDCTVQVETTDGTGAYAVYGHATQATIYSDQTEYDTSSKTDIAQTRFTGEYATAANIKITRGTYMAKAATTTAYAIYTLTRSKTIYGTDTKVEANRTVGGNKEAYVTLSITDGEFTGEATTTTARAVCSGGNTTITGGTYTAKAGTYYAYALYANSGKLTATNAIINAIANGRVKSSDNNAYAYGVFADCGIIGSGNQAWTGFTNAGEIELNNCTVTATATNYDNARGLFINATSALLTQANYEAEKTKRGWSAATWAAYQAVFPGDGTSRAVAAKATVNGGTFTVTAGNATAYGAISAKTVVTNTQGAIASPEMTLNNATFIVKSKKSTGAYGICSGGPTLIDGCTITATAGDPTIKNTASGVLNVDKITKIKNSTITATSADAAYGLEGRAEINATHGYCWHGEFDLTEAGSTTVTAEAKTKSKTAYTIFLKSAKLNIATGGAFDGDYATAASATINGGTYNAKFNTSGSAYVISLGSQQTQGDVVAQPEVLVNGGFFNGATAEVGTAGVVGHMRLNGGYFVHNTNLDTYKVSPKKVLTLRPTNTYYQAPYNYRYVINEGGTVTWKNGTTTLDGPTVYEKGETPAYGGATPTKAEDESYTYTHSGWDPAVAAMDNSDVTYTATFNHFEKKYTVNVAAGANGSASPSSVSNIGCETASGDITATPNTGYHFTNWTLPTGVTAADGYTSESNPIHIHATASGKTITANFAAKTYTVTLDNQSATTAGATSVTATYNAAMPSIAANLPAKTGFAFGGYFTETNGGGTQYYNADGTSAHIWDIDAASPTLYAKWTVSVVETGPYLDVVDWTTNGDGTGTLTINANGWAASGWPYTVNDVQYEKGARNGDRTLTIPYSGAAGAPLSITVQSGGETKSMHNYKIPYINTATGAGEEDIVYVNSGTLNINASTTSSLAALYIRPEACVNISNGTLSVGKLVLRTLPWQAASISGTFDADEMYYTRIAPNNTEIYARGEGSSIIYAANSYYQFGLPLQCAINSVKLSNVGKYGAANTPYGNTWILKRYDEEARAQNGKGNNWVELTLSDNIEPGVGYEMFSNSAYYREFYFQVDASTASPSVRVVRTTENVINSTQAGWNVIVSPLYETAVINPQPENMTLSWLRSDNSYDQENPSRIPPAIPFTCQTPETKNLSFVSAPTLAPRRRVAAAEEQIRIQWIHLDVKNADGDGDQTSIYSHPTRYEDTYKTGIDVAKQSLIASRAIIYSSHAYGEMAFAGVADSLFKQGVALTVYSPKAQELMISMRENDWLNRMEHVWLIDNETGMHVDLMESDYAFRVPEGTTRGRLFIQGQFKAPNVITDIDPASDSSLKGRDARKVMIDQKIYIIVGERMYDATGKLVLDK